jgi:hypothetical protein
MHTEVEKRHHGMVKSVKSSSTIPEEAPDIDSPSGDRCGCRICRGFRRNTTHFRSTKTDWPNGQISGGPSIPSDFIDEVKRHITINCWFQVPKNILWII